MGINSAKLLSVFSTTLTLAVLPGIAIAQSPIQGSTDSTISAPTSTTPTGPTPAQANELSPEQRSAIKQALLRDRNTQIIEVLDEKQKNKFYEALRKRRRLSTALEDLNLSPDQQTRVNAIISEYNNKVQSFGTGKPSKSKPQGIPNTTP